MHNRAEIPQHEFLKIEHRFYAMNLSERFSYGLTAGYNINGNWFKYGEVQVIASMNYMNTTYKNVWYQYTGYDSLGGVSWYNIKRINNRDIHCIDFTAGINFKSKIAGNLFLNSTMGAGLIYLSGFNKNDIGKTALLKPNYILSIGIGYRFSKKE